MPRGPTSIKAHAILASLLKKGLIKEWKPGEYLITARGKKLRKATINAFKWGFFQ